MATKPYMDARGGNPGAGTMMAAAIQDARNTPIRSPQTSHNPSRPQASSSSTSTTTASNLHPQPPPSPCFESSRVKLDISPENRQTRTNVLRQTVFPDWRDDAAGADLSHPDEMRRKDPLGTQIWRLFSKTKSQLPNQERMENLTWRMMAMNLKRQEQERARLVSPLPPTPSLREALRTSTCQLTFPSTQIESTAHPRPFWHCTAPRVSRSKLGC